jgi:hypothetical protein
VLISQEENKRAIRPFLYKEKKMLKIENILTQIITNPIKDILGEFAPFKEIKELILKNTFNIFLLFFSSISLSLLFVSGVVLTLVQLSYQYDQGYRFFINGGILTGLVLIGISIVSIFIIKLTSKSSKVDNETPKIEMQIDVHPLEIALANLINDFISDQNFKRSSKMEQSSEQNASTNELIQ